QQPPLWHMRCEQTKDFASDQRPEPGGVDPYGKAAAGLEQTRQPAERGSCVRRVMEDADAVDEIEGFVRKRKVHDVGLIKPNVGPPAQVRSGCLDGAAQINSMYVGSSIRAHLGKATHAAAGIEHGAPGQSVGGPSRFFNERVSTAAIVVG